MGGAAIFRGRGGVDGRPDQWMAKAHLRADLEQLFGLGRDRPAPWDPQRLRRSPEEGGIPGRIGGGQKCKPLGRLRQRPDMPRIVFSM